MPSKKDTQKNQASNLAGVFGVGKETISSKKELVQATPINDSKKDFISLDITGYRDYLKRMSGAKGMSVTAFIRQMISNHMEENKSLYETIRKI